MGDVDRETSSPREGAGDADSSTTDDDRGARRRRRGRGPNPYGRGRCRECGEPAYNRSANYCQAHRRLPSDRQPRQRNADERARAAAADELADEAPGPIRAPRVVADLGVELRTNLELVATLWEISDPVCGGALRMQAPAIAQFWADQARRSERVERSLRAITSGGGWIGGIAVHAPLIMAVYAHHVAPVMAPPPASEPADEAAFENAFPDYGAAPAPANGETPPDPGFDPDALTPRIVGGSAPPR